MASAGLTLYHWAPSRSTIVRWMLEEVGEPYTIVPVDITKGEQLAADYLALNPMGKVPVLVHDETIVSEVSAICCYLADRFPAARLAPAMDDPRRGPYLKWLFFAPSCIEPAVIAKALGWTDGRRSMLGWADFDTTMRVLIEAVRNAKPYLLGQQFTAADVVIGAQVRWGLQFGLLPQDNVLTDYAAMLAERPALKRQTALDETPPAAN